MPPKGFRKADPVACRIRVQLTRAQAEKLCRLADAAGVSRSEYLRNLLAAPDGGAVNIPRPRGPAKAMLQLVEIHELAMQVRKLGANINQLARQANTGLVPLRRGEIEQILLLHDQLMRRAIAVIERALPE